jgi:short-subunit dehydrogenase
MKILLTGSSSGIGKELKARLQSFEVVGLTRNDLDLSCINDVINYNVNTFDMLINCAGTDVGGKIDFVQHRSQNIVDILNTNLLAPMLLTKKILGRNPACRIVNVTSTNNKKYYANNLAYSLSKKALADFGTMLTIEYPDLNYLEIQLGLTKTNFNNSRYHFDQDRFQDIYLNPHLTVEKAVDRIMTVLFDTDVRFVEVAP